MLFYFLFNHGSCNDLTHFVENKNNLQKNNCVECVSPGFQAAYECLKLLVISGQVNTKELTYLFVRISETLEHFQYLKNEEAQKRKDIENEQSQERQTIQVKEVAERFEALMQRLLKCNDLVIKELPQGEKVEHKQDQKRPIESLYFQDKKSEEEKESLLKKQEETVSYIRKTFNNLLTKTPLTPENIDSVIKQIKEEHSIVPAPDPHDRAHNCDVWAKYITELYKKYDAGSSNELLEKCSSIEKYIFMSGVLCTLYGLAEDKSSALSTRITPSDMREACKKFNKLFGKNKSSDDLLKHQRSWNSFVILWVTGLFKKAEYNTKTKVFTVKHKDSVPYSLREGDKVAAKIKLVPCRKDEDGSIYEEGIQDIIIDKDEKILAELYCYYPEEQDIKEYIKKINNKSLFKFIKFCLKSADKTRSNFLDYSFSNSNEDRVRFLPNAYGSESEKKYLKELSSSSIPIMGAYHVKVNSAIKEILKKKP